MSKTAIKIFVLSAIVPLLFACSTTSGLGEDEQLYVGIKSIDYKDYQPGPNFTQTQEEIEAALAAAPNGAIFGSSSMRYPMPWRLWIWNATTGKKGFSKWVNSAFGTAPVLVSDVSPRLRSSVAKSALVANGYLRGDVDYEEITQKNPKQSKLRYSVSMGHLFTLDSIAYTHFPAPLDSLLARSASLSLLHKGDPFNVGTLDLERQRLSSLFRDNGYYYYQPAYATYLADTLRNPGTVQLRLQMLDSLDQRVQRRWFIGRADLYLRNQGELHTENSVTRRTLTMHFNGRRPPVSPKVIMEQIKFRPGDPFSEKKYAESMKRLTANSIFSSIDFSFIPRDTTAACDTLDMRLDCVFDKPYDFTIEGTLTGKSASRFGPGASVAVTKRNAFHGGENLTLNVFGSLEWQTGSSGSLGSMGVNSYEYGANLTLELPRLLLPLWLKYRWDHTPSTVIKASNQVVNRGSFFNRHILSAELSYTIRPNAYVRHVFSPIILQYDYMNWISEEFSVVLMDNPYLLYTMMDQFIPKLRHSWSFHSPKRLRNPISAEVTFSESANLISLGYMLAGRSWKEKDKHLLKNNPYAQFVKLEGDFTKKWRVSEMSDLVAHVNTGVIWAYGNSSDAPYTEQFYVGGANSIRAFTIRSIGPGRYHSEQQGLSYFDQTGDFKFVTNLEYRPHLFGSLYGAAFLDMGNVWTLKDDGWRGSTSVFKPKSLVRDLAIATGLGLRYDLDFFVIRIDWGIGLHVPYDTGRTGFFNVPNYKKVQSLHLAIGYPF